MLGGRYLYTPRQHKISNDELKTIVRESGVAGAKVVEQNGQWVKIAGPEAPDEAEKRIKESKLEERIACKIGTLDTLPFKAPTFDLIVGAGSMLIWGEREQKMREVHRVLRPGGIALLGGKFLGMPDFRKVRRFCASSGCWAKSVSAA